MALLEIARRKRDQQPLHSLTYRLASRRVLHERSIGSLVAVAGFSFLAAVSSQLSHLGFFGLLKGAFSLYTLILATTYFVFGSLLLGLRNARVKVNPRLSPTYLHDLLAISSDPLSWVLISFYVTSTSILHAFILAPSSNSFTNFSELVVFINEKGIPQINERYILTRIFSIIFGVVYGVRHLIYQKDWLAFPEIQLSTVDYIFNNYWKQVVSSAGAFSLRITGAFWIVYNILLSRLLVNSAMRFVADDILYHAPQYGPRWYSLGLVIRLFFTSFSISIFLESVHLVCDHFLSKKMNVSGSSIDPNACLISGLKVDGSNTTPETLLTYHAFQELAHLAGHSSARRRDIFNDAGSSPSSWTQISSHCISLLNKAATRINTVPAKPSSTSARKPVTSALGSTIRRRLPPGQGGAFETNIFRPSKHDHFFDSLKGLSTEEILAQSRAEAAKDATKTSSTGTSKDRLELIAFHWISNKVKDLALKYPDLQRHLSVIPEKEILRSTDDFHLILWAFQSLARLVAASYDEDNYGVVQKDIPKVLETMLELLMTLESFLLAEAGSAKFRSNPYSAHINAQRLTITRSYAMLQALKTAIYQVVVTFRGQLGEFTLASAYANRLKHFVDFDE
ncbi:Nucleoporin NDC1 [Linnemannia schmuckeri]|uniref:Nucleoporin NDC1 n=1 Tax=Linnemannia schmuckeri TaxID=64567 RepID=A0A9P5S4S6_9FUNG|nr:Nucleoporin NDC1 [Linnemannia schmuckeri]